MNELLRFTATGQNGPLIFLPPKFEFVFYDKKMEMYKKGKLERTINYEDIKEVVVIKNWQNNLFINCKPIGVNIYKVSDEICNKIKEITSNKKADNNIGDFLVNGRWFFNWGKYNLDEDTIDIFLNIINFDKTILLSQDINSLINEVISKQYVIYFDDSECTVNDMQKYLDKDQLIEFIYKTNNLFTKYNLNITITIEDIEDKIKENIEFYQDYLNAKSSINLNIKYCKNMIIYLINEKLKNQGYTFFEINNAKNIYFIAKSNDLGLNSNTEFYR